MSLVFDTQRVSKWLDKQLGYDVPAPVHHAIGFEVDGKLTAAVCFDGYMQNNINAHIVSRANRIPTDLIVATARYAYEQCGLDRVTFVTPESHKEAIDLVTGMNAQFEGRMVRAMKDCDVLRWVMWKNAPFAQRCLARDGRGIQ